MVILILYINDKSSQQHWGIYYGGHEEANTESLGYLTEGFREVKRMWISESAFDDGS